MWLLKSCVCLILALEIAVMSISFAALLGNLRSPERRQPYGTLQSNVLLWLGNKVVGSPEGSSTR